MRLTAYETFQMYVAIKSHFYTEKYDYFKYRGKVKATKESPAFNRYKYQFMKLSRLYDELQLQNFLVANFIEKDFGWVGEILDPDASERYLARQKILQSLSYSFREQLEKLLTLDTPFNALFKVPTDGSWSPFLEEYYKGWIYPETAIILNNYIKFITVYDAKLTDDIVWPKTRKMLLKYEPFLDYDKEKFKNILFEVALSSI